MTSGDGRHLMMDNGWRMTIIAAEKKLDGKMSLA